MARVTSKVRDLHQTLASNGAYPLSPSQLQAAADAGLLDPAADDAEAQGRALAVVAEGRQRLPEHDVAALGLAVEGRWCARLPEAVCRLRVGNASLPPRADPETVADETVIAGLSPDTGDLLAGQLLRAMVGRSRAAGLPWPAGGDESSELHHLGRVQAIVEEAGEVALDGAQPSAVLDTDDLVAVTCPGGDRVAGLVLLDMLDTVAPTVEVADATVRAAEPGQLVMAVQVAAMLAPLVGPAAGLSETISTRPAFVATVATGWLMYGPLLMAGAGLPVDTDRLVPASRGLLAAMSGLLARGDLPWPVTPELPE